MPDTSYKELSGDLFCQSCTPDYAGCPILNFAFFAKFRVGMLLEVLPFETPADASYGQLRTRLEKAGIPIGANDLLIAAQALTLGYVIVTDNEREFSRVKGLRLQNWLRSTE